MSNLSLRHLYKVYPNGVKAVNDFNMEIEDKEFIVFVGPSGCGKSTTLRMIAGLEEITAGELYIGDQFANHMEPKDRDIAMVFQNYALYPHMTVYENLAFGLNLRHVPQAEIHKKVLWAAKILKLEEYLERKPKALSGGQRQRVSLGRAILRTPKVFLLDEPLSNLDAKLRTEMRAEIAKLHKEIGTTFIYVTHDQIEAMTMGTRIVVMSMGYVQQIDTPQNLYNHPENKFVAGFIGTPQMNFFNCTLTRSGDTVEVKFEDVDKSLTIPFSKMIKVSPEYLNGDRRVTMGIRCENVSADSDVVRKSDNVLQIRISHFEELGNETLVYGDLDTEVTGLGETGTAIIVKHYGEHTSQIGDVIDVAFNMDKAHFFDAETEQTIVPRIPVDNVFDITLYRNKVELLNQSILLPPAVVNQIGDAADQPTTGYLFIPTASLYEGGNNLTATVVDQRVINKTHVVHLEAAGRTFFMIGNREYAQGEQLNLGIDFKNITISDSNRNAVVKPLPQFDVLYGSYSDRANAKRSVDNLVSFFEVSSKKKVAEINAEMKKEQEKVVMSDAMLKDMRIAFKNKCKEIKDNMSYRLGTEELGKEGKKKVKKEAEDAIKLEKTRYEEEIAHFKQKKSAYNNLPESEKTERKAAEKLIIKEYTEKAGVVADRFSALVSAASTNVSAIESKLLPIEQSKAQDAQGLVAAENERYNKEKTELTASLDQKIKEAADRVKSAKGEERDAAVVGKREAMRAKKDTLTAAETKHNANIDDIIFNSKVFAAYVNGLPIVTSLDINSKIVKGLGAQLFTSHYRFELPHDAFDISDEGIEVTVEDMLDYGGERFAKCTLCGETLFVKTNESYQSGASLRLVPDIEKSRIYENKFDIRLF